jgi:hygromycin-B 4-O-kinase
MGHFKPMANVADAIELLEQCMDREVENVIAYQDGNISQVYAFDCGGKGYVLRMGHILNRSVEDVRSKQIVLNGFALQGAPLASNVQAGLHGELIFQIAERLEGTTLSTLSREQKQYVMPGMIETMSRMHLVDVSSTQGFGWVTPTGDGEFETWEKFASSFYQPEQQGFWEGWTDLFDTSFLERDIFRECYDRMLHYSKYNAPYRYFIHNDCHDGNIIVNGDAIAGLIDGNFIYGDFIKDLSRWIDAADRYGLKSRFLETYEQLGMPLEHLEERLLGCSYFGGLDAMRFYAKADRRGDYERVRDNLLI